MDEWPRAATFVLLHAGTDSSLAGSLGWQVTTKAAATPQVKSYAPKSTSKTRTQDLIHAFRLLNSAMSAEKELLQGEVNTERFDAVVCCVGTYHDPNVPQVEGMVCFPGRQLHCHNYRHNTSFKDEAVLVVGASFSGQESACLLT